MKKLLVIAAVLLSGTAYAHDAVILELISDEELIEGHKKGETCLYLSANTGEEWWYHKKDIVDPDGRCPFVIKASEL